ncbi:DUF58 domain-containing protein [Microbacterium gorillae]|uniref:DUF58 domain-containing protein n=1 Tax=Microbacterium gorillae TaxID=1231063 RepID=UPI00058B1E22|nr:DUF58 domain-containing protein [Microbacterium gorillae]
MPSLITQVRSKLFITSSRASMHPLDGAYRSLLRGRSMDFEDLRPYEVGDQVRDIDWRASARLGEMLVKRTRATRLHTVMFVVDTGRTMAALAEDEASKAQTAIMAAGALGYLTVMHGDEVALVYGDADGVRRTPGGRSEGALEHQLRTIEKATASATAPGSIDALLAYVARSVSRRVILVVIADEAPLTAETERLVRRLRMQHDMVWLTVADADPVLAQRGRAHRSDVVSGWEVPDFVHGDAAVREELAAERARIADARDGLLDRWAISRATLHDQDGAVSELLHMLDRRARVGA